ncbi:Family of unknown function (DUF5321) [Teratosphaeria destructans]|uniref:Uncharacterized protein n=1 Tax=Teratosphaeria destructans TaxID=418781 RepID=A0A9W7W1G9_9PEZI|nr:Family of unknown function (DUF5321) [Teratosphaeria destructans]
MQSIRPLRPLAGPHTSCARALTRNQRRFTTSPPLRDTSPTAHTSHVPRIAQPSLWQTLIPKPFRPPTNPVEAAERAKRRAERKASRRNFWASPYTPFLFLALLVGSNAIQIIAERREQLNFSRKTEGKIALLKEVIGKVRRGENVDVKGLLGTGDAKAEAEWEEVVRELEETDLLWERRKREESKRKKEEEPVNLQQKEREGGEDDVVKMEGRRPRFLM